MFSTVKEAEMIIKPTPQTRMKQDNACEQFSEMYVVTNGYQLVLTMTLCKVLQAFMGVCFSLLFLCALAGRTARPSGWSHQA